MLNFLAIAAAGYAAYGPPTNENAFDAYIARILAPARFAGDVLEEERLHQRLDFPSDVILQRCIRRQQREVVLESGAVDHFGGYDCIFEVWPNGEPSFMTFGFFRHDGLEWIYYGPMPETDIPLPSEFDRDRTKGNFVAKPGALPYGGMPENPINPQNTPYQDFYELLEENENRF